MARCEISHTINRWPGSSRCILEGNEHTDHEDRDGRKWRAPNEGDVLIMIRVPLSAAKEILHNDESGNAQWIGSNGSEWPLEIWTEHSDLRRAIADLEDI